MTTNLTFRKLVPQQLPLTLHQVPEGLLDDGEHHSLQPCAGLLPAGALRTVQHQVGAFVLSFPSSSSLSSLDFFFLQIDRVKTSSQSW